MTFCYKQTRWKESVKNRSARIFLHLNKKTISSNNFFNTVTKCELSPNDLNGSDEQNLESECCKRFWSHRGNLVKNFHKVWSPNGV